MASQNFKVTEDDEWKSLPAGSTRFTQNDEGTAFFAEASDVADLDVPDGEGELITGEKIYPGVPYLLDATKNYHIRTVGATCSFGLATV